MRGSRHVLSEIWSGWWRHKVPTLAAAIAFYTIFSLAPVLLIATAIAGRVLGRTQVRGRVVEEVASTIGPGAAETVRMLMENAAQPESTILAAAAGTVVLLFGATAVFNQLKSALNTIWEAAPTERAPWWSILRDRLLSLTAVISSAFLLLVALLVSAALAAAGSWVRSVVPAPLGLLQLADILFSTAVVAVLFALVYKILPDARIRWRQAWIGALVTAVLFNVGKALIGIYLGRSTVTSVYGAAGSLAVILVWVYYSALIFLLGAEFTCAWSKLGKAESAAPRRQPDPRRGAASATDERARARRSGRKRH